MKGTRLQTERQKNPNIIKNENKKCHFVTVKIAGKVKMITKTAAQVTRRTRVIVTALTLCAKSSLGRIHGVGTSPTAYNAVYAHRQVAAPYFDHNIIIIIISNY